MKEPDQDFLLSSRLEAEKIDETLGLKAISIRLDMVLIEDFKILGRALNIGYQPLMRKALQRYADREVRTLLKGYLSD